MAKKVDHIKNRVKDLAGAESDILKGLADVEAQGRTLEDDLHAIRLERYELTEAAAPAPCSPTSKHAGLPRGVTTKMNILINHHKGHNTLAVLLIYIQIKGRTILTKKRHTKGRTVSRTHHTGEPHALPSCLSSSLSGAAPRAPHAPAHQGIKHPIIEAHYGV